MKNDIKTIIEEKSRALFNTYGYSRVSMRQIADACGISVGNLTYHYAKKEDLLMCEHDYLMNTFLQDMRAHEQQLRGLEGYLTAETVFIHWIIRNEAVFSLYKDVINIPVLRDRYCHAHHDLYLAFLPDADRQLSWLGTVCMCGMEFELADEQILRTDFNSAMKLLFRERLLAEGVSAPPDEIICRCIENGVSISSRLRDLR